MSEQGSEERSKEERAAGVQRMLKGEDPPQEPPTNDPDEPGEVGGASSVGESITQRGEDVAGTKEAGRHDTGAEGEAERPTGRSTARDRTGVDPQDSVSD